MTAPSSPRGPFVARLGTGVVTMDALKALPDGKDQDGNLWLKEGWTEEELTEVLLHLTGYVGVPIIREAMLVASEVFKDVRAKKSSGKA